MTTGAVVTVGGGVCGGADEGGTGADPVAVAATGGGRRGADTADEGAPDELPPLQAVSTMHTASAPTTAGRAGTGDIAPRL